MSGVRITSFLNLSASFRKKIALFFNFLGQKKYPFYFFLIAVFFTMYALILNQIKSYTKLQENNYNFFLNSNEFNNIKDFVFDNIKSPYKEYSHTVKNNDTLEKVLKKYNISNVEVNNLISKVVEKKLSSINTGSQIQIVTKEEEEIHKIVSLFYPIDAITSVEIKRNKDVFDVSKKVLKLNRKEIVLSNTIKNNLYSAAVKAGIEPNIIVEFANIFGFEVDFQRDIRKGDTFEIYYEQYVDDNNIVRLSKEYFIIVCFEANISKTMRL